MKQKWGWKLLVGKNIGNSNNSANPKDSSPKSSDFNSNNIANIKGGANRQGPGSNRIAMRFGQKTKPKNIKKTIIRLIYLMEHSKVLLLIIFASVLLSTGATLLVPLTIGKLIDFIDNLELDKVISYCVFLLVLYVIGAFLSWYSNYLVVNLSQKMVNELRIKLFERLEKLPLQYFDRRSHGDLMSRFTNDLEAVSNVINQSIITLFSSVMMVFGTLIIMLSLNVFIALGVLVSVPLLWILSKTISRKTITLFQGYQKALGEINSSVEESVNGLSIIQSYHQEAYVLEKFKKVNEDAFRFGKSAQIWSGLLMPLMNVINNLSFTIIGFVGGYLVIEQVVTIGVVASFIAYSRQFIRPLNELAFTYNSLMAAIAGAERVFEVFDEEDEVRNQEGLIKKIKGDIEFRNVFFGYNKDIKVIKDISFSVKQGQKVAVVGPTGAGKTTLVNLLTQFYAHDEGEILVDGVEIKAYNYSRFLSQIGIVLQDSYLFSGTIYENILYGNPKSTKEEVIAAAEFAMVNDIIMKLPHQYATKLSYGGLNLSHGERQLITIARAVLSNPNVLILDEATSSVDLKTEKEVTHAMNRVMKNRTSFVIAHRLSTIRDADIIIVLDQGEIIEKGSHNELIKMNGFYAKMIGA